MSRLAYIDLHVFGEGEPVLPQDGKINGLQIKERDYSFTEPVVARFAISTLLYQQGHPKRIAHELSRGFDQRFIQEREDYLSGEAVVSWSFDFDLDDLNGTPAADSATCLREHVARCSKIADRIISHSDIGGMPMWAQGLTAYGVSEGRYIHIAQLGL